MPTPTAKMPSARFDGGRFFGQQVSLGELRTDDAGRLLVFGGAGAPLRPSPGRSPSTSRTTTTGTTTSAMARSRRRSASTGGDPGHRGLGRRGAAELRPGIQSVVTMYDVIFEAATYLAPELRPARRRSRARSTRCSAPGAEPVGQRRLPARFRLGSPSDFLARRRCDACQPSPGAAPLRRRSSSASAIRPTPAWSTTIYRPTTATGSHCRRRTPGSGWRCCRSNTPGSCSGPTAISTPIGPPDGLTFPNDLEDLPARRATGRARPRGPGRLPRRSIPPGLRVDLADAPDPPLRGAVPAAPPIEPEPDWGRR